MAKDQDLERGAFDYRVSKNDIVIYKRKDNKPVHIISNFHGTEPSNVQRKNRDGSVQSIYHVQKLFPTIIYIWEGWTKLICFALYMASPENRKNGGTVFLLV